MGQKYPQPQQGQAKSREEGGSVAPAGVWEHPETGKFAITTEDPLFGNAMSQAFLQAGFRFVREAKPEEIKTLPQLDLERRADERETLRGLSARLEKFENVATENEQLTARIKKLEDEKKRRDEADAAKAAEDATEDQKPSEKPLDAQNDTDVRATAEAEGVDLSGANTVKEKRALVQAARDAKKESEN